MNQTNKSKEQLTQEELQKTQVLNLQDVERVAHYEKITSKKPAIIVAIIGVISILIGSSFPVVQSLVANKDNNKNIDKKVEKKLINSESTLNCTYTSLNNPDGTDTILNFNMTFNDNKLIKHTKTFTMNPTVGNSQGSTTVSAYYEGYQPFMTSPISGYQMAVTPVDSGLVVTTAVDYTIFNPTTLPALHQGNVATLVEYQLNTDKTAILNDLTAKGYSCS